MAVRFDHLTRAELDHQLSPSLTAKDAGGTLARHIAMTEGALNATDCEIRRDIAYGDRPAERLDLVLPRGDGPHPCLIFVHGGFWQEGSKSGSGFAARALAAHGWASALVGYTLAPEARLSQIVAEIARAVDYLAARADQFGLNRRGLVLGGHSAGGHLTAAILAGKGGPAAAQAVSGAILISGVYDLAPIASSYVNDAVRMDAREVEELSLLEARPLRPVPILVMAGADESESFLDQTEALWSVWADHTRPMTRYIAPGRDHFDILDTLTEPGGPALAALQEMYS